MTKKNRKVDNISDRKYWLIEVVFWIKKTITMVVRAENKDEAVKKALNDNYESTVSNNYDLTAKKDKKITEITKLDDKIWNK